MKTLIAILLCATVLVAGHRPKETNDEAVAASDAFAAWIDHYPQVNFWVIRRDPPTGDGPWTLEIYEDVAPKVTLVWRVSGYGHLSDGAADIEHAFASRPQGFESTCLQLHDKEFCE